MSIKIKFKNSVNVSHCAIPNGKANELLNILHPFALVLFHSRCSIVCAITRRTSDGLSQPNKKLAN